MITESRKSRDAISMVIDVCDTLAEIVPATLDEFIHGRYPHAVGRRDGPDSHR